MLAAGSSDECRAGQRHSSEQPVAVFLTQGGRFGCGCEHVVPRSGKPSVGAQQQQCLDGGSDRAAFAAVLDRTP
jgi:hypothetical protein